MDSEPIQIQVSAEEIRQFAQGILSALSSVQINSRPLDQFVTVENRCKDLWPTATTRNRRRIRDVCLGIHRERLGRHPYKLTGHLNGTFAIERDHLDILDRAIDIVKEEVEARESTPLFSRRNGSR
jgi:hypothetical protein